MSQAYATKAQAAGDQIELIELPGEDHFVLINVYSDVWERTVEAIRKLLHLD
jgi:hypothetical protein